MVPQRCPHPNPKNPWYVTSHGKGDLDVTKLGLLQRRSWISQWGPLIMRVLRRGRRRARVREGNMMTAAEAGVMCFKDGRRSSHEPGMQAPLEAGKGKETEDSPPEPSGGTQFCQHHVQRPIIQTSGWIRVTQCKLLCKIIIHLCCFKPLSVW